jgi:hypothetical protein
LSDLRACHRAHGGGPARHASVPPLPEALGELVPLAVRGHCTPSVDFGRWKALLVPDLDPPGRPGRSNYTKLLFFNNLGLGRSPERERYPVRARHRASSSPKLGHCSAHIAR